MYRPVGLFCRDPRRALRCGKRRERLLLGAGIAIIAAGADENFRRVKKAGRDEGCEQCRERKAVEHRVVPAKRRKGQNPTLTEPFGETTRCPQFGADGGIEAPGIGHSSWSSRSAVAESNVPDLRGVEPLRETRFRERNDCQAMTGVRMSQRQHPLRGASLGHRASPSPRVV